MNQNNKSWIVCQIGARENYSIPRALHQSGRLDMLMTDIWHQPGGLLADLMSKGKMFHRWHPDLADARVTAANASHLNFEVFHRIRKDAKSWHAVIQRNALFQRNCIRILQRDAGSRDSAPRTVFAFSYAARDLLKFAKSKGWTTVLGQIDPGPHEEALVAEEHIRYPGCGSTWRPAPPTYWEHWREETELADQIICNSPWARDGLVAVGVPLEKIRIVPLFHEVEMRPAPPPAILRSADLQSTYSGAAATKHQASSTAAQPLPSTLHSTCSSSATSAYAKVSPASSMRCICCGTNLSACQSTAR